MPLGVPGGYRIGLWQRPAAGGYRVDLVGTQSNGPASLGDHDHEGHPGWRIDQIDATITGCLDVDHNLTANGTAVLLWTCTAAANQRWSRV